VSCCKSIVTNTHHQSTGGGWNEVRFMKHLFRLACAVVLIHGSVSAQVAPGAFVVRQLDDSRSPLLDIAIDSPLRTGAAEVTYLELGGDGNPFPGSSAHTAAATPGRDYLQGRAAYPMNVPFCRVIMTWSAPVRDVVGFCGKLDKRGGVYLGGGLASWSKVAAGSVSFGVYDPCEGKLHVVADAGSAWRTLRQSSEAWIESHPRGFFRALTGNYDKGFRPLDEVLRNLRDSVAGVDPAGVAQTLVIVVGRFSTSQNQNNALRIDSNIAQTLQAVAVYDMGSTVETRKSVLDGLRSWQTCGTLIGWEKLNERSGGRRMPLAKFYETSHALLVDMVGERRLATVKTQRPDHAATSPFRIGWVGAPDVCTVVLRRQKPTEAIARRIKELWGAIRERLVAHDYLPTLAMKKELESLDPAEAVAAAKEIIAAWQSQIEAVAKRGSLDEAAKILAVFRKSGLPSEADVAKSAEVICAVWGEKIADLISVGKLPDAAQVFKSLRETGLASEELLKELAGSVKVAWLETIVSKAWAGDLGGARAELERLRQSDLPDAAEMDVSAVTMLWAFTQGRLEAYDNAVAQGDQQAALAVRAAMSIVPQEIRQLGGSRADDSRMVAIVAAWLRTTLDHAQDLYATAPMIDDWELIRRALLHCEKIPVPVEWQQLWRVAVEGDGMGVVDEVRDGIKSTEAMTPAYLSLLRGETLRAGMTVARDAAKSRALSAEDFVAAIQRGFKMVDSNQRIFYAEASSTFFEETPLLWKLNEEAPDGLPPLDRDFLDRVTEKERAVLTPLEVAITPKQTRQLCWLWLPYGPDAMVAIKVCGELTDHERSVIRKAFADGLEKEDAQRAAELGGAGVMAHVAMATMVRSLDVTVDLNKEDKPVESSADAAWDYLKRLTEALPMEEAFAHLHRLGRPEGAADAAWSVLEETDLPEDRRPTEFTEGAPSDARCEEDRMVTVPAVPFRRQYRSGGTWVQEFCVPFRVKRGFPVATLRLALPILVDIDEEVEQ
jgi:hypothetical protein